MSEFFEKNKKGLSKNFSMAFGYRAVTMESWFHPGKVNLILQKYENGRMYYAKPVEITWVPKESGFFQNPEESAFIAFDVAEEQEMRGTSLIDALVDLFTPADKKQRPFIEGELQATKKHLEDMRRLALEGGVSVTGTELDPT